MRTEREFLHDISTPMSTVLFILDSLLDDAQGSQKEKLERLQIKINDLKEAIESRRDEIKSNQP